MTNSTLYQSLMKKSPMPVCSLCGTFLVDEVALYEKWRETKIPKRTTINLTIHKGRLAHKFCVQKGGVVVGARIY